MIAALVIVGAAVALSAFVGIALCRSAALADRMAESWESSDV